MSFRNVCSAYAEIYLVGAVARFPSDRAVLRGNEMGVGRTVVELDAEDWQV